MRTMWGLDVARGKTLARLTQHQRQCEAWWKCEVATHLWDFSNQFGPDTYVWLEACDRADIVLATGAYRAGKLERVTSGAVCIPIELKMVGTFWGRHNIKKAYSERGKKRLEQDMRDARLRRRSARPFAAVGLLVTHVGVKTDSVLELYLQYARKLGEKHRLELVLDEGVSLPPAADEPVCAHQCLWITPSVLP
jgi:hypothetical protein